MFNAAANASNLQATQSLICGVLIPLHDLQLPILTKVLLHTSFANGVHICDGAHGPLFVSSGHSNCIRGILTQQLPQQSKSPHLPSFLGQPYAWSCAPPGLLKCLQQLCWFPLHKSLHFLQNAAENTHLYFNLTLNSKIDLSGPPLGQLLAALQLLGHLLVPPWTPS